MSVTPSSASKLPASDYVIFGGTGDLSFRKIFPAFFWRYLDGQLTDDFRLLPLRGGRSTSGILPRPCDHSVKMHLPKAMRRRSAGRRF